MSTIHAEPTRVRERGTKVTLASTPAERIAAVRAIVAACQYAKVDGYMVDLFTASAIVSVYDALNEKNREMLASFPIDKMARIAFKLVSK